MYRSIHDRWLDELDRQLRDPYVIDDPSLDTAQLTHRANALRTMRGSGRDRMVRALMRQVTGLASMYPRRFDLQALHGVLCEDAIASRDSEATLMCNVPTRHAS